MKRRYVRLFIGGVLVFALIAIIAFAGIMGHKKFKKLTRDAWRDARKIHIRIVVGMLHNYIAGESQGKRTLSSLYSKDLR